MGAGSEEFAPSSTTSFSRPSAAEFLETANTAFSAAATFWRSCDKVILTPERPGAMSIFGQVKWSPTV